MKKKYFACYMPATESEKDPSKGGFNSEKEAWNYISTRLCKSCKLELDRGYQEFGTKEGDSDYEKFPVEDASDTTCGCEWLVMTEEDYRNAESIHDLFEAGGFKKIYNKEELK